MSNNRPNYSSALSINYDLTKNLQCDEQIKEFTAQKCRKKCKKIIHYCAVFKDLTKIKSELLK